MARTHCLIFFSPRLCFLFFFGIDDSTSGTLAIRAEINRKVTKKTVLVLHLFQALG